MARHGSRTTIIMTGGAGVIIWATMGVMMPGMITGGHQDGLPGSPATS
jgi:hypothetical protein